MTIKQQVHVYHYNVKHEFLVLVQMRTLASTALTNQPTRVTEQPTRDTDKPTYHTINQCNQTNHNELAFSFF